MSSRKSRSASKADRYQARADPRGKLIDLPFEIREHHLRARAADEVGVERRCSAGARGGKCFGRLLKLAESRVDVLQLCRRVAAASPQARNDEHQAEDQRALAGHRQPDGVVPIQHLGCR